MTVISFKNIIVWPVIPRLADGVKLYRQVPHDAQFTSNVVVLPVVKIIKRTTHDINGIEKVIRRTVRGQRNDKRNTYALEKLRKMFLHPA